MKKGKKGEEGEREEVNREKDKKGYERPLPCAEQKAVLFNASAPHPGARAKRRASGNMQRSLCINSFVQKCFILSLPGRNEE